MPPHPTVETISIKNIKAMKDVQLTKVAAFAGNA
jgi:hypothetical protein